MSTFSSLITREEEAAMAKRYGRPSKQYRYEHYDPFLAVA
jgi:hypothetical protein